MTTSLWTEVAPARAPRVSAAADLLRQGLSLMLLRRPASLPLPAGLGLLWWVALGFLLGGALVDDLMIEPPRWSNAWAVTERCFPVLIALLLASLICQTLGRPRLTARLAATGLFAATPWLWAWPWLSETWLPDHPGYYLPYLYALLLSWQCVRWLQADSDWRTRLGAVLLSATLLSLTFHYLPWSSWWWTEDYEADTESEEFDSATADLPISAEALWNLQPQLLGAAAGSLAAQRPGVVDLYTLGVAGDGSESVFRNEIRFLERLAAERLALPQRMFSLINHPDSVLEVPLASVTNLRQALSLLAARMNTDEDLLLLFLTSHGSEDHQFYLGLSPLPLDPLDPATLREALDASGIRWRVLVVSSCYSGGFVDALKSPETLVITAARADRPSFGCGSRSDITWFGEAFLTEALNQSTDFFQAFRQAKQNVRSRELEQGEDPSYPQIERGALIGEKLSQWQQDLVPGPTVAFRSETVER